MFALGPGQRRLATVRLRGSFHFSDCEHYWDWEGKVLWIQQSCQMAENMRKRYPNDTQKLTDEASAGPGPFGPWGGSGELGKTHPLKVCVSERFPIRFF